MVGNLLISGCSTGIGRACALHFSKKGYHVFAGVRKESDAESLREEDDSGNLEPVMLDITNEIQMGELKAELDQRIGDMGLAGLINNAGIADGGPLEFVDPQIVRDVFETNLMGPLLLTQHFLPLIRTAKGRIITVGSMAGKVSGAINGAYHISKFGVEAFCDSLRQELRPFDIHVSLIEPGPISTPMMTNVESTIKELVKDLPEAGQKYYSKEINSFAEKMASFEKQALPPQAVTDVIEHALEAKRPKTRYPVTMVAKIFIFLKWLLPDRAFDYLSSK